MAGVKESLAQVFSREFCEIFKSTFTEHFWVTASGICIGHTLWDVSPPLQFYYCIAVINNKEWICFLILTYFWPIFPFYTPWKHQKTFSGVFRGYKMGILSINWLTWWYCRFGGVNLQNNETVESFIDLSAKTVPTKS